MSKLNSWLYDERKTTKRLKIASVTIQCDLEPEKNRAHLVEWVTIVLDTQPDVELILFGETITGWYARRDSLKAYHQSIAETIPGETTRVMSELARENGIYLSFGMTETNAGEIYNTQVLINPQGEIEAVHRKFHLMESSTVFKPGKIPLTVADISGVCAGIIVCSDIQNAAVRKELKNQKVDLILGGLANPKDPNFFVSGMIAKMFDAWIVTANRYGDEEGFIYEGDMIIGDPSGRLYQKTVGKEQFLYANLFFLKDEAPIKKILRRVWVGFSFIPYLLSHSGMFLQPIKARLRRPGWKRKHESENR